MKKYLLILTFLLTFLFIGGVAYAAEQAKTTDKYDIKYPIAELGNCKSLVLCRTFCDDPVNSSACLEYASKKGFYKQEEQEANKKKALPKVKYELGCDSEVSCRSFCEQPANFAKCSSFAKRYKLSGGQTENTNAKEVVEKAKEELGCNSTNTCKSFCEKEENRSKCSEFARNVGLSGGEKRVGPGGCTSEESCKAFCAIPENYKVCQSYTSATGSTFRGPGGCDSEEACKTYCEKNPNGCGGNRYNLETQNYNPVDMCNRTPGCWWGNNTCNCQSQSQTDNTIDPASECVKYTGCVWSGKSCKCSTPVYGNTGSYNVEEYKASCIAGECKWNGNGCDCTGSTGLAVQCGNKGCTWMNSQCQCRSATTTSTQTTPNPQTSGAGTSGNGGGYSPYSREQQEYYCKAGGGTCDWSTGICNCKGFVSPYSTPTPAPTVSTVTFPTTNSTGSTMTREQQEATCKSGGGTCEWSGDMCSCRGYSSSGSTTTNTTTTTTNTTSSSRDQQEAGCRSCGGTCNWSGDMCNCRCGSQSNSPTPTPQVQAPDGSVNLQAECSQFGGTWTDGRCVYPSQVRGATTVRSWWDQLLDWLF